MKMEHLPKDKTNKRRLEQSYSVLDLEMAFEAPGVEIATTSLRSLRLIAILGRLFFFLSLFLHVLIIFVRRNLEWHSEYFTRLIVTVILLDFIVFLICFLHRLSSYFLQLT